MKKKIIYIIILACFLVFAILPYLKVEILTLRYGKDFERKEYNMITSISYCKVMEYRKNYAEVLYVSKGKATIIVKYERDDNGEWVDSYWECIWSSSGSADGFIWPFYR